MSEELQQGASRIWNRVQVVIDLDVCHKEQWYCEKLAKETVQFMMSKQSTYIGDSQYYIDLYGDDKFPMMYGKIEARKPVEDCQ
ncbi:MAG: hypothetical protein P4L67_04455 [Candidatus Pacebacteria bacterium]|nr:hypothetical protein [Candidatus Paceibacterota bacterium]